MNKIIVGILVALSGICFIIFKTQIATLLLGGPAKVRGTVWIEDQRVLINVSNYVEIAGWPLLLAGLALLSLGVIKRQRMQSQQSGAWL